MDRHRRAPRRERGQRHWRANPARAVPAIGRGLRALHDALPVADCPFDWSASARLDDARRRAAAGRLDPARWHEDDQAIDLRAALAILADVPPVDQLVVCHGDACAPNPCWTSTTGPVTSIWARSASPTAGPTSRSHLEHGVELRTRLGGAAAGGVRRRSRPARTADYRLLWDLGP